MNFREHPEIQSRLRKEIHSVLGKSFDPKNPPTPEKLDQLHFLNNVCREVLRVDPPGQNPLVNADVSSYHGPSSCRR